MTAFRHHDRRRGPHDPRRARSGEDRLALASINKTCLIAVLGNELWRSCLAPNAPRPTVELRERMKRPRVGDLVVEFSAGHRGDPDGVGWLRGIEFADGVEGGHVNIDGGRAVDVWVIEPIDKPGRKLRWNNATFFAIPPQSSRFWLAGWSA